MIIRIVRMHFKPENLERFRKVFDESKNLIRNFPGCFHLELLSEAGNPEILYTYSHWNTSEDLENYRNSELFSTTWAATKVLFADKPRAWSMVREEYLP